MGADTLFLKKRFIPSKRFIPVLAAALLGAACNNPLSSPQPSPSIGDPIVVGAPLAATGNFTQEGALTKQGYELWADWANRDGGILVKGVRHPVKILYEDDASQAQQAAMATEKLITQEGAKFLLAPFGTTNAVAAAGVADKHHMPMVASNAIGRAIFTQGYKYVFGVVASADSYPQAVIDMALSMNPKPITLAIVTADDLFSLAVTQAVTTYATSKGQQIVFMAKYQAGSTNLYPLVQQAKAKNPDIFLNLGHLLEAVAAHKAAKDLRLDAKMFIYAVGPGQPEFVQALGNSADYTITASPWTPQARFKASYYLSSAEYVAAFRKKYNTQQEPSFLVADATAAGVALQKAIETANSLDPDAVRDALVNLDINTFFGRIKFDAQGQNTFKNILVVQVQNGQTQTVWPPEVATSAPVYPTATWEARFGLPPEAPKAKLPSTGHPAGHR
jgi:branched-chain amino acid transport system substrate-binding protein